MAALAGGASILALCDARGRAPVDPLARHPTTPADGASHASITRLLAVLCPGDPVRSEEGNRDEVGSHGGRLWIVDPLDGTRDFVDGRNEYSVMIGLAVDGECCVGAVYQPAEDRLFLGAAAGGAWRVESASRGSAAPRPVAVSDRPATPLRLVQSRSHPDPRLVELARRLEEAGIPCRTRLSGSVGIKCAVVASDEADLYVHPVPFLREWDTCAGEAIARGAGVRVTDCEGGPLRYGKPDPVQPRGILAAPPGVWRRAAPFVRSLEVSSS